MDRLPHRAHVLPIRQIRYGKPIFRADCAHVSPREVGLDAEAVVEDVVHVCAADRGCGAECEVAV